MKIIDSNIWISFFNRDDVNHIQSEQILKECMGDTFCVTDFIISEVLTVLSQKASKEIANNFAEFVYNSSNVKIIYTSKVLF
jgi:predicted nucleic acid-binding protein